MLQLKYVLPLALLLATTSTLAQTATNKRPEAFVTVCEVLGNRGSYDGKVVALIGRWSPTDEGFWLADDCENPVKTGEYVWSNIIFLAYDPSSASIFAKGPKLDLVAANKTIADLKARHKPTNDKLEWAVVYGRVETKEELPTVSMREGQSSMPAGYGHLNAAPAQIVYREKDLVIIPPNRR
jgi:hypothetical protein